MRMHQGGGDNVWVSDRLLIDEACSHALSAVTSLHPVHLPLSTELAQLNSVLTVEELQAQIATRLQQVQEAETKLAAHRGGGIVAVSAEDVAAAEQVRACLWGTRCLPGLSCPGHRMQTLKGPVHACPDPACILSLQRSWC